MPAVQKPIKIFSGGNPDGDIVAARELSPMSADRTLLTGQHIFTPANNAASSAEANENAIFSFGGLAPARISVFFTHKQTSSQTSYAAPAFHIDTSPIPTPPVREHDDEQNGDLFAWERCAPADLQSAGNGKADNTATLRHYVLTPPNFNMGALRVFPSAALTFDVYCFVNAYRD